MARITFVVVRITLFQIFQMVQKTNGKTISKEAPEYDY